jgi:hypothetical protein
LNLADADFSCTNVFHSSFCCEPHFLFGKNVSSHGVRIKMGLRIGLVLSGVNAFIIISELPCCGGSTLALRFFVCEAVTQQRRVLRAPNAHLNQAGFALCFVLLFLLLNISQILSCFHDAKSWRKESDKNPGRSGCIAPPAANPNRSITGNGPQARPTTSPSKTRTWKEVHHFLNSGTHWQENWIDATNLASPGD